MLSHDAKYNEKEQYFKKVFKSLSQREIKYIQSFLRESVGEKFVIESDINLKNSLIRKLLDVRDAKELVEAGLSEMPLNLIAEKHFKWLENNLRAQLFTMDILGKMTPPRYIQLEGINDDLMEKIQWYFDSIPSSRNVHVDRKIEILNSIASLWINIERLNNCSKWLKSRDIKQMEWTENYLKSKGVLIRNNLDPINYESKRALILASIDTMNTGLGAMHLLEQRDLKNVSRRSHHEELFIDKMKRAWSQQKYRNAGKTKKPYHLPLTKETKSRLEKMSEVQGLAETAMLDMLINRFYDLDYLDSNGKDLY
ncbi:hypothetical protein [Psychrobacter fozii]|uniref:Uncharacterized protein n=1 Tax=Psychrobacter fozii TaxID=198480 RepID=A0A2V4UYA8_9GAMM|nr:hypothetical protein [Psychrobacter fozii]PYE38501.1 hypothetical protein DFP82_107124 [Psychrobacter fozii]